MKNAYSALFGASLLLCAGMAHANLLVNGSFESYNPILADGSGSGYWTYNAGNVGISGWTVGDISVDVVDTTYPVFDGAAAVDLVGTPGPGSVSQTLTGLSANTYVLDFWAKAGAVDFMTATLGGNTLSLTGMSSNWTEYQVSSALSGSALVSLESLSGGTGNLFVDKVSVEAVPEPCTMALLALGSVAALRRKMKKA